MCMKQPVLVSSPQISAACSLYWRLEHIILSTCSLLTAERKMERWAGRGAMLGSLPLLLFNQLTIDLVGVILNYIFSASKDRSGPQQEVNLPRYKTREFPHWKAGHEEPGHRPHHWLRAGEGVHRPWHEEAYSLQGAQEPYGHCTLHEHINSSRQRYVY